MNLQTIPQSNTSSFLSLKRCPLRCFAALFLGVILMPLASETIRFSAMTVESVTAEGRERTVLQGDAQVDTDRVQIKAQRIEILGSDQRTIRATGGVLIIEKKQNLTLEGDSLEYDRTYDILLVSGNAMLEDADEGLIVRGGIIENRGEQELAIIQVGVRILKEDLVARAEVVQYHRNTQQLELSGNPLVFSDGDEYRANRISINLDTDDILLDGRVTGIIEQENRNE